jgi:hypothetical protein
MTMSDRRQREPRPTRRAVPAVACLFAVLSATSVSGFIVVGCTRLPSDTGLPRGATLVAETPDFKAGFTAPDDGTVYIFTRGDTTYLRYSGPIKKGDVLTIDPEANAVTVGNKPLEVTVPGGGHYQVYFRPASADLGRAGGGL